VTRRRYDNTTTRRRTLRLSSATLAAAKAQAARLVIIQGEPIGQRLDLGECPAIIGRSPECEMQIAHPSVSRQHCRIWRTKEGYRIQDLNSTNKTFVNDQPVIEAELKDGDLITVGTSVLKFMEQSSIEARYHEELYQLATIDPLTELYNRRQYQELLGKEFARTLSRGQPLALLLIDIDHFKAINDRHGHPAGDTVLKRVAGALLEQTRADLILARIGGEEFAAILPEHTLAEAAAFAERLRHAVESLELDVDAIPQPVTISIGVAPRTPAMAGVADLMRAADAELYRAKQAGRNRVCTVSD
jgi:diguanylate cyclase (GGDEF)-like protein